MKILYVGFDGLGLDVIQMPQYGSFKWMRENGNWGRSAPKIAHTFPSWTSINTGLAVAKHKVTNVWQPWYSGIHNKHTYLWDYVRVGLGLTCGVLTFPMTYPPRKWDTGWFVSGYPSGSESPKGPNFYPDDLRFPEDWETDWVDYVRKTWSIPLGRPPANLTPLLGVPTAKKLLWFEDMKLKFVRDNPRVEFLAVQLPAIDRIGHEMIKPEMKGQDQKEPLPIVWKWANDALEQLIEFQEPDYILVTSDHGMNVELHTYDGVWMLVGPGVGADERVDIDNWRVLPSFLDAVGLDYYIERNGLSSSALVSAEHNLVEQRLKALGYLE